jgi:Predicted ATPase (AAA+ superfamily)
MRELVQRNARSRIEELLSAFRMVMVGGVRQSGKTTLVRDLLYLPGNSWFSFDDEAVLSRAIEDPIGLVDALPMPAAVDEFQRAGRGFLLAVKQASDRSRARGQLLLTGSTNYLALRDVSETLAGRVGRLTLWPLSAGERRGVLETFVDSLFDPAAWPTAITPISRPEVVHWILEGGYPEVVTENLRPRARRHWFEAYVHDVVSREALRPIAEVRLESELRRLLRLVAARTATELVVSDLAADAELARETTANYLSLLEALHVVTALPAWSTSTTTAAKRRPKLVMVDTGLAADLCGIGEDAFAPGGNATAAGALFETLIITEVLKQATWSERDVELAHFRDRHSTEIDLIVEDRRTGQIAAIEVKLTSTPVAKHAKHLQWLQRKTGDRFTVGLVIHTGSQVLPLADRIWAVPVAALWRTDGRER